MRLNTTSQAISLLRELETKSAAFYQSMAEKHSGEEAVFTGFVKENRKNISTIERTYFGVITDALEGCFAFDIDPQDYDFQGTMPNGNLAEDLSTALEMEGRITRFYVDAATQSKSLMADIPRVMERIARARAERQNKLKVLLDAKGGR
jgi:rubrerythrin